MYRFQDQGCTSSMTQEAQTKQDERVDLILKALEECISEKGFASTTLTDISLTAKMSPSHIRYYFEGKDAILNHYFDSLCTRITEGLKQLEQTDDREVWIDRFVNYFETMDKRGLRILMEIFGLAVHNPNLYERKVRYDRQIRKHIEGFFEWAGCIKGITPAEAAERFRAFELGVKISLVFDNRSSLKDARKMIAQEMRRLCGI